MLTHSAVYVALSRVKSAKLHWLLPERCEGSFSYLEKLRPNPDLIEFVNEMKRKGDKTVYIPQKRTLKTESTKNQQRATKKKKTVVQCPAERIPRKSSDMKPIIQTPPPWSYTGQLIPDTVVNTLGSLLSEECRGYVVLDSSVPSTVFKKFVDSNSSIGGEIRTRMLEANRIAMPFYFDCHFAVCLAFPNEKRDGGDLPWFDSLPLHSPKRRNEILSSIKASMIDIFGGAT